MKNLFRRAAAAVVIAVLLLPSALAADPLGSRLYDYTLDICDGTTLTHQVLWGGSAASLRTENFVTYTPNPSVSPKVSFGATIPTKQTVASMARDLEGKGSRVLSGINGDYFVMATGSPLGLVVTDGVLRSSASYLSAIGFRADGSAVAGKPDLKLRANFSGHSLKIAEINKLRSGEGYFLFTDDFGATTRNTRDGVDVILVPTGESGQTVSDADKTATLTTSPHSHHLPHPGHRQGGPLRGGGGHRRLGRHPHPGGEVRPVHLRHRRGLAPPGTPGAPARGPGEHRDRCPRPQVERRGLRRGLHVPHPLRRPGHL